MKRFLFAAMMSAGFFGGLSAQTTGWLVRNAGNPDDKRPGTAIFQVGKHHNRFCD